MLASRQVLQRMVHGSSVKWTQQVLPYLFVCSPESETEILHVHVASGMWRVLPEKSFALTV